MALRCAYDGMRGHASVLLLTPDGVLTSPLEKVGNQPSHTHNVHVCCSGSLLAVRVGNAIHVSATDWLH